MRPERPGEINSLWDRMSGLERVIVVAAAFLFMIVPMTLVLAELIKRAFN